MMQERVKREFDQFYLSVSLSISLLLTEAYGYCISASVKLKVAPPPPLMPIKKRKAMLPCVVSASV